MIKFFGLTALAAATLALGACSAGGGSDDTPGGNNDGGGNTTAERYAVEGPLDPVQSQLSTGVFDALAGPLAGTPLAPVLTCADFIVTGDIVDILDTLAVAAQTGTTDPAAGQAAFTGAADSLNSSGTQLAADLQGLLTALAGSGSCGADGAPSTPPTGDNPLAGTPLAPLGAALAPVLAQLAGAGGGGGGGGDDANLTSVANLYSALNDAFQSGYSQLPAEAVDSPVVGALLQTLSTALNDLDATTTVLGSYNGPATATAVSTTLDHLLVNVLTKVVPVTTLEDQSGQGPVLSGPITDGVHQLTTALDGALGQVTTPVEDALAGPLAALLDPIENQVLAPLLGPIADAISGGGTAPDGTNPFEGTPLAPLGDVLGQITGALSGGGGTGGTTGTPLDVILDPIVDAISAGGGSCPVADTPLAPLCTLLGALG